jgi:iron complex outermembrane recepter protein
MNHSARNRPSQFAAHRAALPALAATILLSNSYGAQSQQASDRAGEHNAGLEEVLVTATRRETDLEDVPFSISALSGADLERDRILSMEDVTVHVPGLVLVNFSTTENYLSIRGAITVDDSPGSDQGTSLYVDDVVRTGATDVTTDLYDVARIEVLKGPQGTLFGRNATGGVVSVHTKDPVFKSQGQVEASYGNYNLRDIKGMLNRTLIDGVLAGRLVATSRWRDGWIDDTFLDRDLQNQNQQTARGKLLFTPTDDLQVLMSADYLHFRGLRGNMVYGNFVPVNVPVEQRYTKSAQGFVARDDLESWGASVKVDWTTVLGTLTSISAYRHVDQLEGNSATADPAGIVTQTKSAKDEQLTQELRLASAPSGKFTWVTGVYYLDSNKTRPIDFLFKPFVGSFFDSIGLGGTIPSIVRQNTNTHSLGVFGEGTYGFTKKLSLTLGARYTHDSKDGFSLVNPANVLSGPMISASYDNSWTAFTPKVTLTYEPSDALLTYLTVSKGYQGGGYNTQGSTQSSLALPFDPTILWNYEAGVKFTSADRRFRANASAFLDRYDQLQLISFDGNTASSVTTNAGKSQIRGLEADMSVLPFNWLTLGAQYAFLDSKFTSYIVDNGPGEAPSDFSGNPIPYVPKHSLTLSAELHFDAPRLNGRVAIGGDYTYRSTMTLNPENSFEPFIIDKTKWDGLINMHASWTSDDDRWSVSLWGKNLRNIWYTPMTSDITVWYQTAADRVNNPGDRMYLTRPNTPRTFGVTVQTNF